MLRTPAQQGAWRRRRTIAIVASGLIVIAAGGLFIATRPSMLASILSPTLGRAFGGEATIARASWDGWNAIHLEDLALRAPGIDGDGGRVLQIDTAVLHFSGPALPFFGSSLLRIDVDGGVFRLGESGADPAMFNVMALGTSEDDSGWSSMQDGSAADFPDMHLHGFMIESGIYEQGTWRAVERQVFDGRGRTTEDGEYRFEMSGDGDDLNFSGRVSRRESGPSLHVEGLVVDETLYRILPPAASAWLREISLQGEVADVAIARDEFGALTVSMEIGDMTLLLPQIAAVPWTHYEAGSLTPMLGEAKVRAHSGTIRLAGGGVQVENLAGEFESTSSDAGTATVPFRASVEIEDLPAMSGRTSEEWLGEALELATVRMSVDIEGLHSRAGRRGAVDLPEMAGRILQMFSAETFALDLQFNYERKKGEDSLIGKVMIEGGSGEYEWFQYPLHDVKAIITVKNDDVVIESLQARGADSSTVQIWGDVLSLASEPTVDLTLMVQDAPVDAALRRALSPTLQDLLDRLFDKEAIASLSKNSVLPDAAMISDAKVREVSLSKALAELGSDTPAEEVARLRLQQGQAAAMGVLRSFEPGGTIDLEFSIASQPQGDVAVTGKILFDGIGVVHREFPYPVVVGPGEVIVGEEYIVIGETSPVPIHGPGGGRGAISGRVDFPDGADPVPELVIELAQESITPTLVQSVSMLAGDSYQTALALLNGLGLQGKVIATGKIAANGNGGIAAEFAVGVSSGTSILQPSLATAIGAAGPFWPPGFWLGDVSAFIQVSADGIEVTNASATSGECTMIGAMSISHERLELNMVGQSVPISDRLVGVLPPESAQRLASAWHVLSPRGTMDATFSFVHTDGEGLLTLVAEPNSVALETDWGTEQLVPESGTIRVVDGDIRFEDFRFAASSDERSDGVLHLNGKVQAATEEAALDLQGGWESGNMALPLIRGVAEIAGGSRASAVVDSYDPEGRFIATIDVRGEASEVDYDVVFQPTSFHADFGGRRVEIQLEQGRAVFQPGMLQLEEFSGRLGEGVFGIGGTIRTSQGIGGLLSMEWRGPADDPALLTVLPGGVGTTFEAIELAGGQSEIKRGQGQLRLHGESFDDLGVVFEGDLDIRDTSIVAGLPLKDIDGVVHINGAYEKERLSELDLILDMERLSLAGRTVTDVGGVLRLDAAQEILRLEDVRGWSSGGVLAVTGSVGIGDRTEFDVTVLLDGVQLASADAKDAVARLEGALTAWFGVAGDRGNMNSRHGRGRVTVRNGNLATIPASMQALRILEFTPPTADVIDHADIELYLRGDELVLESIWLEDSNAAGTPFIMTGIGTIAYPEMEVHAVLKPRAGWAGLRDVAGVITDALFVVDVSGPLLDPTVSVVVLPSFAPSSK
ncbi:MAG: hypothetical protein QGH76_00825 [Phycisphaerales bacterium]|nr:hypothetical protein [Phycisphaerales bacterium]